MFLLTFFDFNPLPRKEGDAPDPFANLGLCEISIHSLVKRETYRQQRRETLCNDFNPLPRKEGDAFSNIEMPKNQVHFNPLPRKEGDCHHLKK